MGSAPIASRRPLAIEAEDHLTWLATERGRSVNTLRSYRRDLRAYDAFLADRSTELLATTTADLADYVAHLRAEGKAPASVTRALVAIRSLFRFLTEEGVLDHDPGAD